MTGNSVNTGGRGRSSKFRHLLLFLVLAALAGPCGAQPGDLAGLIEQRLRGAVSLPVSALGESIHARPTLTRFYVEQAHRPAWSEADGRTNLEQLLVTIELADTHGLNPNDYHLSALRQAMASDDRLAVELLATDAYLTLAANLVGGRLITALGSAPPVAK